MLSIHYNYGASHASRNFGAAQRSRATAMEQISSGFRINKGADGPADLIISEQLRSQIEGLERAIRNTGESNNILGIMEGALGQVQGIITKMRGLAIESANTGVISSERVAANQAELDSGLQAIDRILGTTSYGGQKLLENMQQKGLLDGDPSALINAGQILQAHNGKLPLERLYEKDGVADKLFMLTGEQNNTELISADGKTLYGDKTFVLPPSEEGGKPVELTFKEGTSLDEILRKVREHAGSMPSESVESTEAAAREGELLTQRDDGTLIATGLFSSEPFARRVGGDINRVELDAEQLASLAGMDDETAKSNLGRYMQNFTKEIELDINGWSKLSNADKSMLLTADRLANLSLSDMGTTRTQIGVDKDGKAIYSNLSLRDLFSGGAASLSSDPVAAMSILDKARKDVTATRAQIAATQNMNAHTMNAMEAQHEATVRYESYIRDTEYAEATTEMARADMVAQASMSVIGSAQRLQKQFILDLFA